MLIECTLVVLSKEELKQRLQNRGIFNPNRFLTGSRPVTKMELRYVEYLILDYRMESGRSWFQIIKNHPEESEVQEIRLIGNGSTGSVSFLEATPDTELREIPESMIQPKEYDADDMSQDAKYLTVKIGRRLAGRYYQKLELTGISSIYRPFWIAYYGEPRKDGKVLCCPHAADGFIVKR